MGHPVLRIPFIYTFHLYIKNFATKILTIFRFLEHFSYFCPDVKATVYYRFVLKKCVAFTSNIKDKQFSLPDPFHLTIILSQRRQYQRSSWVKKESGFHKWGENLFRLTTLLSSKNVKKNSLCSAPCVRPWPRQRVRSVTPYSKEKINNFFV